MYPLQRADHKKYVNLNLETQKNQSSLDPTEGLTDHPSPWRELIAPNEKKTQIPPLSGTKYIV